MMRLIFSLTALFGFAGFATAGPIVVNDPKWYEFGFGGSGTFAVDGSSTSPSSGGNSQPASSPPWTFTSGGSVNFTVTDAFSKGDSFSVFDFGVLVGSTPFVPSGGGATDDPAVAVLDPTYSHGSFLLSPGSHSITIRADNSPFGGGAAYFRADAAVSPVPEPSTFALFGSVIGLGLGGFFWNRRRRASAAAA